MKKSNIFKGILLISFTVLFLVACEKSQKQSDLIDNEKVIKDIIMYNQEILPDLKEAEKTPEQYAQLVEKTNSKITEQYGQYFSDIAQKTLITEIVGRIQEQLLEYSLPIHIENSTVEEGSYQTVTIYFKDSNDKEGQFVFRIQNTNNKISYIYLNV